jgi:geranylgeranyl pyrophosphate synthase
MPSAVRADNLAAALEAAVRRFDGSSPVTAQVHAHFSTRADGAAAYMRLVLEVAAAEGASAGDALDAACAIETLYNATVVHGDLRSGRSSPFGLAHGINAGDALCALAYLQLLDGPARRPAERTVAMIRALHAASYALCAGHAAAIGFERAGYAAMDEYVRMLEDASALFAVACELGALAAGAAPERALAYARLGRSYGKALQIDADVRNDSQGRTWTLPAGVSAAAAQRDLAAADAAAAAAGIDAGRGARDCLTYAIRSAA